MFHDCSRPALSGRCRARRQSAAATALKFLRDGFEQVALDDVAHLVFAEISQLDAALEADAHFFHVVLETAERREAAVVNGLALPHNPRARRPRDAAVRDEAAGYDALA